MCENTPPRSVERQRLAARANRETAQMKLRHIAARFSRSAIGATRDPVGCTFRILLIEAMLTRYARREELYFGGLSTLPHNEPYKRAP